MCVVSTPLFHPPGSRVLHNRGGDALARPRRLAWVSGRTQMGGVSGTCRQALNLPDGVRAPTINRGNAPGGEETEPWMLSSLTTRFK